MLHSKENENHNIGKFISFFSYVLVCSDKYIYKFLIWHYWMMRSWLSQMCRVCKVCDSLQNSRILFSVPFKSELRISQNLIFQWAVGWMWAFTHGLFRLDLSLELAMDDFLFEIHIYTLFVTYAWRKLWLRRIWCTIFGYSERRSLII